jgi:hypothetical protein
LWFYRSEWREAAGQLQEENRDVLRVRRRSTTSFRWAAGFSPAFNPGNRKYSTSSKKFKPAIHTDLIPISTGHFDAKTSVRHSCKIVQEKFIDSSGRHTSWL